MAKLRIFISSTYYDLKHIRNGLENFIHSMGYEPVLYESGGIAFNHDLALDESCYREIENAHMQILVIGGRYGSEVSQSSEKGIVTKDEMYKFYNSITKHEYDTALVKNLPVYIFVEKQVLAKFDTYKRNKENEKIRYAHVDSINIFKLLEEIYTQKVGNFVKGFEKLDDITSWLRDQWSGLFAEYIKDKKKAVELESLSARVNELNSITNSLKEYTEAIMKKIGPDNYEELIQKEDDKIEMFRANSFAKESLILILYELGSLTLSEIDIYNIFKSSSTFGEFLDELYLPTLIKEEFLKNNYKSIKREFKDLKSKYQNIKLDDAL